MPVLHLVVGPNGAGKSTLVEEVLSASALEFVNADILARLKWPGEEILHSYDAARMASERRQQLLTERRSFIAETVFSHPSKLALITEAKAAGYIVELHVVMIPKELAVFRVSERVSRNGHAVPEEKIRSRFDRLWDHVEEAIKMADRVNIYDNSSWSSPLRVCALYLDGIQVTVDQWPAWAPFNL